MTLPHLLAEIRERAEKAYDDEWNTDEKWIAFTGNAQADIKKLLAALEKCMEQRNDFIDIEWGDYLANLGGEPVKERQAKIENLNAELAKLLEGV